MQLADLDVVAVHAVVAHLERLDAGALALALLQIEQELVGVLRQVAQLVELGIVTLRDDTAVADQYGRVFNNGFHQQRMEFRMALQRFAQGGKCSTRGALELAVQFGNQAECLAQHREIPRTRAAQRNARDDALDIADAAQDVRQGHEKPRPEQFLDGVEACIDLHPVTQRAIEPAAQQAAAHDG